MKKICMLIALFILSSGETKAQRKIWTTKQDSIMKLLNYKRSYFENATYIDPRNFIIEDYKFPKIENRILEILTKTWTEEDSIHYFKNVLTPKVFDFYASKAKKITVKDTTRFKKVYDSLLTRFKINEMNELRQLKINEEYFHIYSQIKGKSVESLYVKFLADNSYKPYSLDIKVALSKLGLKPYLPQILEEIAYSYNVKNYTKGKIMNSGAVEKSLFVASYLGAPETLDILADYAENIGGYKSKRFGGRSSNINLTEIVYYDVLKDCKTCLNYPTLREQIDKLFKDNSENRAESIKKAGKLMAKWLRENTSKIKLDLY